MLEAKEVNLALLTGARAFDNAFYGQGTGMVLYYNLDCSADDTHLDNCSRSDLPFYCNHYQDAGVQCNDPCINGSVRLVDGSNPNEGRVEVCKSGVWGTVCNGFGGFGTAEARVICRHLNLPYAGKCTNSFFFAVTV